MTITCADCGREFEGYSSFSTPRCPPCAKVIAERRDRLRQERSRLERQTAWPELCPPAFCEIDPARLPDPALLEKVLAWRFGPMGLLLLGPTGRGKTRCAWQLLKREHLEDGRRVAAVDSFTLSQYPSRIFADSVGADAWLRSLCKADIVLLDDPFKAVLSARVEEALFLILDKRTAHGLPLIVTTNDTGQSLAGRLSTDRTEPIIRRIREFTDAITT